MVDRITKIDNSAAYQYQHEAQDFRNGVDLHGEKHML